jgi:inosose dehydratase
MAALYHGSMTLGIAGYRCLQAKLSLPDALSMARDAGAQTFEPLGLPDDAARDEVGEALARTGLTMPSLYVNSRLHEETWPESLEVVLAHARRARSLGASRIVTNPEPIAWGQPLDKTDPQLETQKEALIALQDALESENLALAYHVHDMELRHGARELHHMLLETSVDFCLDAQWLYRGCGDSFVATKDIVTLYAGRVSCVHVRQSARGVCSETLTDGDIDWPALFALLRASGFDGPVSVELLKEKDTPEILSLLEAHRQSLTRLQSWLALPGTL